MSHARARRAGRPVRSDPHDRRAASLGVGPSSPHQRVLAVAVCGGDRCTALHGLRDDARREPGVAGEPGAEPGAARTDVCGAGLRAAIEERPDGVLLTVACPGACHLGGVAAVGWASASEERLAWLGRPLLLSGVEEPGRKSALADWVRTGAPDAERLPRSLG